MSDLILVPVSAGEMFDKITILEIKNTKITDTDKKRNVLAELTELKASSSTIYPSLNQAIVHIIDELRSVNLLLWQIEDDIRDHERKKDFGDHFVQLARSVYIENDRRAKLKKEISVQLGSTLVEEKSYADY